jgi:hypothetical protein
MSSGEQVLPKGGTSVLEGFFPDPGPGGTLPAALGGNLSDNLTGPSSPRRPGALPSAKTNHEEEPSG